MHGSNPALRGERADGKADELERVRRGRYCRQLREAAGISLQTMANRTFRDKSTLSRFENGKTTPADVGSLITQYEALGDPVAAATQRSSNATDVWIAALWDSLALFALVAAVVPDDTGADVIRVGAIVAALATTTLTVRALRYRAISPLAWSRVPRHRRWVGCRGGAPARRDLRPQGRRRDRAPGLGGMRSDLAQTGRREPHQSQARRREDRRRRRVGDSFLGPRNSLGTRSTPGFRRYRPAP